MTSTAASTKAPTLPVTLSDVCDALAAWCRDLDPARVSGEVAARGVEQAAVAIRRLQAAQARLAARADDCRSFKHRARSAEQWLAQQNGCSQADARRALDASHRPPSCPATAEAFAAGELSVAEAAEVTAAVLVDPAAERRLVDQATSSHDLRAVRDAANDVRRRAYDGESPTDRRVRLRRGRYWREFTTADGHHAIDARLDPTDWLAAKVVLDAYTEAQLDAARRDGRLETHDAHRADAVIAALTSGGRSISSPPGTPPAPSNDPPREPRDDPAKQLRHDPPADMKDDRPVDDLVARLFALAPDRLNLDIMVLVDATALKRGRLLPGERCEIPGYGAIDVDVARALMRDHEVHLLVHDTVDIRAYARRTRHRPEPLTLALRVRHPECAVPGCHAAPVEVDHAIPHDPNTTRGPTSLANLTRLCRFHHDQKTHRGARLVVTATEILWWPPVAAGAAPPPPGSVPWRAPLGEHLTSWPSASPPQDQIRPGAQ